MTNSISKFFISPQVLGVRIKRDSIMCRTADDVGQLKRIKLK